ncbi:MAG: hypothetical protein ISS70_12390 [Phycisphaerae bacterium]|nr:hypothetical protein [Phycisphaerae bacterium]
MKPTVYIETSIISYVTARASRDLIVTAHQQLTLDWWDHALPKLDAYVSPVVIEEIAKGDPVAAGKRIEKASVFAVLELSSEIQDLAENTLRLSTYRKKLGQIPIIWPLPYGMVWIT